MWCYRKAKAAELSIDLQWLRRELDDLCSTDAAHAIALRYLSEEFAQVEQSFGFITSALSLNDDIVGLAIDRLLLSIHRYFVTTSIHYIATLRRQVPLDLRVRDILLNVCARLRLYWVEDIVVCIDRPLALLPRYRGLYSIPVFYGPPTLLETILELPGIYHELGHNVFARDDKFRSELAAIVKQHFATAKQLAGPMSAAQKAVRDRELDAAALSWTEGRLAKVFCDLFAGYVSGSANYGSIFEMGMMTATNPFLMNSPRHPPEAARVRLAYLALTEEQKQNGTVENIREAWNTFSGKFTSDLRYRQSCADQLLSALASRTLTLLSERLPDLPRYTAPLPSLDAARAVGAGITLEDVINAGVVILFEAPDEFPHWQQQAKPLIEQHLGP